GEPGLRLAAALEAPRVTDKCVAALTPDGAGAVLIREALVKGYLLRHGTPAKATVIGLAAKLGLLAYAHPPDKEAFSAGARELEGKAFKVLRLKSAREVAEGLSDDWDAHSWLVTFLPGEAPAPPGAAAGPRSGLRLG